MGCSVTHPGGYMTEVKTKVIDIVDTTESGIKPIVELKQNPYMALTHKDIFHLRMSWKGIRRALDITGVNMFIK